MAREAIRFWHQQPVRYRDVDMQHIVYYGKYLEYFDIALYEYFRSLGILIAETAESGEFDTAVVHVEVDYTSPARFDQVIAVGVRVERLGGSSFDVAFEIREAETDREICRARLVLVNFDRRTGSSRAIPDRVRMRIKAFEGL